MEIIDQKNLIPNISILEFIVKSHPFGQNLQSYVDTISVCKDESSTSAGARIEFDRVSRKVTLYLTQNVPERDNYEYILYHEFSHVADRINPAFGFLDDKNESLSDMEQLCLMEIWNVFIDARLNHYNLFKLGDNDKGIYCTIDGKLQLAPFSIEGKLLRHISFLRSRGIQNANMMVRSIWKKPDTFRSYDDLIKMTLVREDQPTAVV